MRGLGITGETLGAQTDVGQKCGRSLGMWWSETHVITKFIAFGRVVAGPNDLTRRWGDLLKFKLVRGGCVANCNPTKDTPATFTVILEEHLQVLSIAVGMEYVF